MSDKDDRRDHFAWDGEEDLQIIHRPKVNVKAFFDKDIAEEEEKKEKEDMKPLADMEPEKK